MIDLTDNYSVEDASVSFTSMRARGSGGQHVNTTNSAVQLRFDINASGLSEAVKAQLLTVRDRRLSDDGVLVLKAQAHRSQARNRADAIQRLGQWIEQGAAIKKQRKPTRVPRGAKRRRVENKVRRARVKLLRRRPIDG